LAGVGFGVGRGHWISGFRVVRSRDGLTWELSRARIGGWFKGQKYGSESTLLSRYRIVINARPRCIVLDV